MEITNTIQKINNSDTLHGLTFFQFYRYRRHFTTQEMVEKRIFQSSKMAQQVIDLSIKNPTLGFVRLSIMLRSKGIKVAPSMISYILTQKGITTKNDRILKLEEKAVNKLIQLTDLQIYLIEKANPCFRERLFESSRPGESLSQDIFYVTNFKGIGKVYLQTVVDTYSSYAFGLLHSVRNPIYAVSILNNHVLPFYKLLGLKINNIYTDIKRDYCGNETHSYKQYLVDNNIEQLNNRKSWHRTNGFAERFSKTSLNEFFGKVLNEKKYVNIESLQADFDNWLIYYNMERPHQGYRNMGKSPIECINDYGVSNKIYFIQNLKIKRISSLALHKTLNTNSSINLANFYMTAHAIYGVYTQ